MGISLFHIWNKLPFPRDLDGCAFLSYLFFFFLNSYYVSDMLNQVKMYGLSIPCGGFQAWKTEGGQELKQLNRRRGRSWKEKGQPAGGADWHAQIHPAKVYFDLAGVSQASGLTSSK